MFRLVANSRTSPVRGLSAGADEAYAWVDASSRRNRSDTIYGATSRVGLEANKNARMAKHLGACANPKSYFERSGPGK